MKKWLQPTTIIAMLAAITALLAECRKLHQELWKRENRIEFQDKWIEELRKEPNGRD